MLGEDVVVVGWIVAPKRHVHPEPVNVTLFGNRISASVIKDLKMGLLWIYGGGGMGGA